RRLSWLNGDKTVRTPRRRGNARDSRCTGRLTHQCVVAFAQIASELLGALIPLVAGFGERLADDEIDDIRKLSVLAAGRRRGEVHDLVHDPVDAVGEEWGLAGQHL